MPDDGEFLKSLYLTVADTPEFLGVGASVRNHSVVTSLGLIFVIGVSAAAGQGVIRREDPPPPGREIERSAVNFSGRVGTGPTRVLGTVIDIRQIPVSNVRVQLRNLDTGEVEQSADSNSMGEYEFTLDESGTYVVEMLMVDGYVVALSNAGSLARSETLQTVVQLPGRWDFGTRTMVTEQNMSTFFGMSAETTMTASTIQIAVAQDIQPADSGTPVSPH